MFSRFHIVECIKFFVRMFFSAAMLFLVWIAVRILLFDQFVVPSDSMFPTLMPGDRILVNKTLFGARVYKRFQFGEGIPLESYRLPGRRAVRPNDIVVFNAPYGYERGKIEFRINYVYAKRCIGSPGDTVSIRNGFFRNNRFEGVIGDKRQQQELARMSESMFPKDVFLTIPQDESLCRWTLKELGPLYIPRAGCRIALDALNCKLYRLAIEYETGCRLEFADGTAKLDGHVLSHYTFRKNYYFLCGDNVIDSRDCRYLGFIPEEFIIGIVSRILYSRDPITERYRQGRWLKNPNR